MSNEAIQFIIGFAIGQIGTVVILWLFGDRWWQFVDAVMRRIGF